MLLLAGCGAKDGGAETSQLAAVVGEVEITQREVDRVVDVLGIAGLTAEKAKEQQREVLEELIRLEALAQRARREGLDRSPDFLVDRHLAEREVLARAVTQSIVRDLDAPAGQALTEFVRENPVAFGQRQLLILEEISFSGINSELAASLDESIAKGSDLDQLERRIKDAGLNPVRRIVATSTDALPEPLLKPLLSAGTLKPVVVIAQEGQGFVVKLRDVQPLPLEGSTAKSAAFVLMTQAARAAATKRASDDALAAVAVSYHGVFADLPSKPRQEGSEPAERVREWISWGATGTAALLLWPALSAVVFFRTGRRWLPYPWPLRRPLRAPRLTTALRMARQSEADKAIRPGTRWLWRLHWLLWWMGLAAVALRGAAALRSPEPAWALVACLGVGVLLGPVACRILGSSLWRSARPLTKELQGDEPVAGAAASLPARPLSTLLWLLSSVALAFAALTL